MAALAVLFVVVTALAAVAIAVLMRLLAREPMRELERGKDPLAPESPEEQRAEPPPPPP